MSKEDKYGILWSEPEGEELDITDEVDAELEETEEPEPVVYEPAPREKPEGVVYTRGPTGRIIEV